ncbi:hypothetical protein RhiirA1_477303 [Rhizophagus irregularis]|uniref:Uncharacterized protein n=1 Tax=Rhizophagus irregularis TaxID=588596 RepID=A0A2N0QTQ3_9GLOM|nr:hypothetical protein RhiirA1_477303 [Rhizophagus irregularis]
MDKPIISLPQIIKYIEQKVFTIAHRSDLDFIEIIDDGNIHLQQSTNVNGT